MRSGVEEPEQWPRCVFAARTDTGLVRRMNQDRFGIAEDLGLAVVCDGMGGPGGGEIASSVAVESFVAVMRQEIESCRASHNGLSRRALCRAAAAANRAVRARASFDTRFRGMGTTLVGARLDGRELTVVNVGDSRAYLLRNGTARQITKDHSYVGEQVRMGLMSESEASQSPLQSVITRAVGTEEDVQPEFFVEMLDTHDHVLLCSDGLTRHVEDREIAAAAELRVTPDVVCERLIEMANARGGSDNITCVLMRVGE